MEPSLPLHLDSTSGLPMYRQLADQIRFLVESGVLPIGQRLPSIRQLAGDLAVNPTTIVKALNELAHAGVIELQHGRGAFVSAIAGAAPPDPRSALRPVVDELLAKAQAAGLELPQLLDLIRDRAHTDKSL